MRKTTLFFSVVIGIFLFFGELNAAQIFHARLDGREVFRTNSAGNTKLLFKSSSDVLGIAAYEKFLYTARDKGSFVEIQKTKRRGRLVETWNISTNNNSRWYDLAIDPAGLWAVCDKHIFWTRFGQSEPARTIEVPDGYTAANGIAYDPANSQVYVLIVDESGLDRNQPAIIAMTPYGEEVDRIYLPGATTDLYFGLGYDAKKKEFWTSTSFQEIAGEDNHLVCFDSNGLTRRIIPISHQYGTVECLNDVSIIEPEEPVVVSVFNTLQDGVLMNGIKKIGAYKVVFNQEEYEQAKLNELALSIFKSEEVELTDVYAFISYKSEVRTVKVQLLDGKAVIDLSSLQREPSDGGEVEIVVMATITGANNWNYFVYTEISKLSTDLSFIANGEVRYPELDYDRVPGATISN